MYEYTKKYEKYPFTLWDDTFPQDMSQLAINPYNFLFLHEPNELFGFHTAALQNHHLFTGIITWSDLILSNCPNGIKFVFNGRVLDYEFINNIVDNTKKFEVSFLCGTKDITEGHVLRHNVFKLKNNINIPKKWFYTLDDFDHTTQTRPGYAEYSKDLSHIPKGVDIVGYGKRILFEESMFNIVIENVNHLNWYNKIGDNFLTKTVPLYWGCTNVEDSGYDERGIIRFTTPEELINILNNLTPETYYKMKPYIDHNYEVAKLDEMNTRIEEIFNGIISLNNL